MEPKINITRSSLQASGLREALDRLANSDVLVGIPQATTGRKGKINNAALMYIHTNGSPARNIPKRPVIEPALAADGNRQVIEKELRAAASAQLDSKPQEALAALQRAGMAGANASKEWFTDPRNNWPPNKPATIRRKKSSRPLIDTGALRRSITYVVRQNESSRSSGALAEAGHEILDVIEDLE